MAMRDAAAGAAGAGAAAAAADGAAAAAAAAGGGGGGAHSAPRSAGSSIPFSLEDVEALAQQGSSEVDYDASLEIERIREACAPASEADAEVCGRLRGGRGRG
jgi:hypothetical protein